MYVCIYLCKLSRLVPANVAGSPIIIFCVCITVFEWKQEAEKRLEEERALAAEAATLVAEAEAKTEAGKAQIAELSRLLKDSEREGDALEERISELEGQLAAAIAASKAPAGRGSNAGVGSSRLMRKPSMDKGTNSLSANGGDKNSSTTTLEVSSSQATLTTIEDALSSGKTAGYRGAGSTVGSNDDKDDGSGGDPGQRHNQRVNTALGPSIAPLNIPPPLSSSHHSSQHSGNSDDFAALGDQYVVIKQLTADFQAERVRDLQLIAQMQDEMSDLNTHLARLQEQEKCLKAALREVEDRYVCEDRHDEKRVWAACLD